ncbi:MAG: transcription elongation factor GreA [Deltaproteobacteria bacterium]|nr:transcription elongation factor GreA [Deltaproteobacteria bacterium]
MTEQRIPMTPEGYRILKERLKRLKEVERPKNIAAIETARGHGDLSENAEYDAAKEQQGHINQQMKETEHALALAQVIDPATIQSDKVVFGATVTLADIENDEHVTYTIVGSIESNIQNGKISIESPIARALIGKEVADVAKVKTPKGIREFEIIDIKYGS